MKKPKSVVAKISRQSEIYWTACWRNERVFGEVKLLCYEVFGASDVGEEGTTWTTIENHLIELMMAEKYE
jgi:hypothetical protein